MNKDKRINQHKDMINYIVEKETEIAEEIARTIIYYYDNDAIDFDELYKDILDFIYISLKQTYKITISEGKKIYTALKNEKVNKKISRKEINKYLYSNDNLTLVKRVKQYIDKAKEDNIERDVLIFYETRILDNETLTLHHKLLKDKLKNNGIEIGMVITGNGCGRTCCNGDVEEWIDIDDLDEPPYHPNCKCTVIYDEEEIELEKKR